MIKDFVGGDIGCALLTFSDKSLHLFPQTRELFSRSSRPGKAGVQAKTRDLSTVALAKAEAELAKLN